MVRRLALLMLVLAALPACATKDDVPLLKDVSPQPLISQAQRLVQALNYLGSALREEDQARIKALSEAALNEGTASELQQILDPYCLAFVNINPEARVKVKRGTAAPRLIQNGWVTYLVKVQNESGTRASLVCDSPNAAPVVFASSGKPDPDPKNDITPGELDQRFLEVNMYGAPPLDPTLSGATLEYRVLQLYTTKTGQYEATLGFNVGQGTQDIGYRNAIHVLFDSAPSVKVVLRVKDEDGSPTMASFIIRDNVERFTAPDDLGALPADYRNAKAKSSPWQREGLPAKPLSGIYPLPSRRVADHDQYPDFYFQPQVYRADGEVVFLPPGKYDVTYARGPEYLPGTRSIEVKAGAEQQEETFELKRWGHLAKLGWYSGDHHVHAGGCSHYESPEAGVKPEAMFRQAQGENLDISCVLTWGPCWYHQKSFFEGTVNALSTKENLIRYDVEVSGFPSSHAGHLCLLRLKEDDYPNTTEIEQWPSWTLPILKWTQEQGGVGGYSHSGWGLETEKRADEFPNYLMPKFNGIGANEFIVTATLGACDFISAGDTPLPQELNIWYHTLNCGLRTSISGETDFPCIFDDRIGMARSYAKLEKLDFDTFAQQIKKGANYVSDGRSHLINFQANGQAMGENGGEVKLEQPAEVTLSADVLAYLPEAQDQAGKLIEDSGMWGRPYWHLEKARIPETRKVPVELVVNGYVTQRTEIVADGSQQHLEFKQAIDRSSWVALRVLASCHTNPIYLTVGGAPIHASKRSAKWCRESVDTCWKEKQSGIRVRELDEATDAYNHARKAYDAILADAYDDTNATLAPTDIH